MPDMNRILLTGAAGALGRAMRPRLARLAPNRRLNDIVAMAAAGPGEEVVQCDLGDPDAVQRLVQGCEGIIHLGGKSTEGRFDTILNANIVGTYNIYEAARKSGVRRILFASTNHTIGFHERARRLDADAPLRPDSLYGASKVYGEALARLYFDKFGIETAIVRIGSCFPAPVDRRMLSTWLSPDDFFRLAERVFSAPSLGCPIIYGASDNSKGWWDNSKSSELGWMPQDSADVFASKFDGLADTRDAVAELYQGGKFASAGHFEDPENQG